MLACLELEPGRSENLDFEHGMLSVHFLTRLSGNCHEFLVFCAKSWGRTKVIKVDTPSGQF